MKEPMEAKMLNPTNQQDLIIKNTGGEGEMTKSFSITAGIFCLVWKLKGQMQSIWSRNLNVLLSLFFKNKNKFRRIKLIYFPLSSEGQMLTVLRGGSHE